jgi:hypothetical protein
MLYGTAVKFRTALQREMRVHIACGRRALILKEKGGVTMSDLRELLQLPAGRLEEINALLLDPKNATVYELVDVVERYGGPAEINRKAREAGKLENLIARLQAARSPYVKDLTWMTAAGVMVCRETGPRHPPPRRCGPNIESLLSLKAIPSLAVKKHLDRFS